MSVRPTPIAQRAVFDRRQLGRAAAALNVCMTTLSRSRIALLNYAQPLIVLIQHPLARQYRDRQRLLSDGNRLAPQSGPNR